MKVEVFTFCWNEMAILPFAVAYWRRYASHVTVFDNQSTDGSREYLNGFKDFITVVDWGEGHIDNIVLMNSKNDYWKQARGRADLCVVCDMDEMLIPAKGALERMLQSGGTVCTPIWYDIASTITPVYNGKYLHEMRPMGNLNKGAKTVLFNPNRIEEINYSAGAHTCDPRGDVRWYGAADIYLLHTNNSLSLQYKLSRYKQLCARRSDNDIRLGHSIHYAFPEDHIREEFENSISSSINYGQSIRL